MPKDRGGRDLTAPAPGVGGPREPVLLPRPRSIELAPGGGRVVDGTVTENRDRSLAAEGYRLEVADTGIHLTAADDAGARHGRATLAQLRHDAGDRTLPACRILDWPDFAVRGVMLDVARDRVPTVEWLSALVDRLAGWKLNQLQLYTEHTFAYVGHDEVWRHASPYTPDDLRAIEAHCRSRGIELVANQNTLGHFERWLRHDRYRPLAIAPDGFDWVFGVRRSPMTLDPANPGAFALVADLLGQLLPVLESRRVHIGLDEPWELAPERRPEWVDWLTRLTDLPVMAGRQPLVWGDVLAADPDLLGGLPEGVTVCEWGYEDDHPFAERAGALAAAGVPFWMSPGTSSWLSISGRVENMLGNIKSAAVAGLAHGATGMLTTDWGDMGHHQQPVVSEPGLAAAAAFSWCVDSHLPMDLDDLATMLDVHAFDDRAGALGGALVDLGRIPRSVTPQVPNMSALVFSILLPQWRVGRGATRGLTDADLESVGTVLDTVETAVGGARPRRPDGDVVLDEVRATVGLLRLACRDARLRLAGDGSLSSVSPSDRTALAAELDVVIAEHRRLWAERFRPGGLDDSVAWFERLGSCYRTGEADRNWFGPPA
ncbi:MAG TPA: family 20 glycosylhydrolase [Acidimicrobiales bacterium]|nr:family 20 glycosylhydrolase [Acidimicrobiales bacterium]